MEKTDQEEKKTSPELEKLIAGIMHRYSELLAETEKEDEFPPFEKQKVTQRWEYIRDRFGRRSGPYLYLYWKENGKLRKKYVGKSAKDYDSKQTEKTVNKLTGQDLTHTQWKKRSFIEEQCKKGNTLAEEYKKKLDGRKVTIDWAYKVVKRNLIKSRMSAIEAIAKKYNKSPFILFHDKHMDLYRLPRERFDDFILSDRVELHQLRI